MVWALLVIPNLFSNSYLFRINVEIYVLAVVVKNTLTLAIVYANFLILIPRYFVKKRYVVFALWTILLLALILFANFNMDKILFEKMGWKPSDIYGEMIFYVFNTGSYTLTAFLLFSAQEKQKQKQQLDQVQLEKLGTEIKYLRAQINPHFLFNTLNNLYGLALEKSEKTPEIILKLSKIMDYMLYESNELKVYLKKDIDNIRNYIDIERIRQGNNAEIIFEVNGEIADQVIVPLTLLPLVENAFKHGVNTIIKGAYMHVKIWIVSNDIEIDVKNNFKKTTGEDQRNGIGLTNLQQRLDLFYPDVHTMKVDAFDDEYHVNLKLRLS